jgi:L-2,4-diaminobutyric acid acetyltransferase
MENSSISQITFRCPQLADGLKIYNLIAASPPLDVNSSYLYFLQSSHFAQTCVLAEQDGELLGFVSGYLRPDKPTELFVWQMVVAEAGRGKGIAKNLVRQQLKQALQLQPQLASLSCTISPSNQASQGVFKSLAKHFGMQLSKEEFLTEAHFAGQEHEAEDYYCLQPPAGQSMSALLAEL